MNYRQKKIGKVLTKLFGSLIKAGLVMLSAIVLCGGFNCASEAELADEADNKVQYNTEAGQSETEGQGNDSVSEAEQEAEDDGFANPTTGVLTSSFGQRWGRNHNGIDIGADTYTEIYAADSGTVTYSGEMSGYGNYIVIGHENGLETAYAHCNSLVASMGEYVEKGQLIAYVGSTGNSTGPHLHFEVKLDGEFKNPLDYVVY